MRQRLPPRLYLAKSKGRPPNWVIRDGVRMIRTGAREDETQKAGDAFAAYLISIGEVANISSEWMPPRRNPAPVPSTVYFLTCDQPNFPIKIGVASDVGSRLSGIQCALPFKIVLLATMRGSFLHEKMLHERFSAQRLEGEWFERNDELLAVINDIKAGRPVFDWSAGDHLPGVFA